MTLDSKICDVQETSEHHASHSPAEEGTAGVSFTPGPQDAAVCALRDETWRAHIYLSVVALCEQ